MSIFLNAHSLLISLFIIYLNYHIIAFDLVILSSSRLYTYSSMTVRAIHIIL